MKKGIKFINLMTKYSKMVITETMNWLKKNIMGWQWFRDFFNVTIFRYFVTWFALVPVFAKILEKLPKEISIPLRENIYTITLELPFKWQILWFSSLSFVVAFILYKIFVPTYITKYFSLKYYKEFEHSPRWLVWEAEKLIDSKTDLSKFIERMTKKGYITKHTDTSNYKKGVNVEEKQTKLNFEYQTIKYEFALPIIDGDNEDEAKTTIAVREIFWEIFGRFSSSKIVVRGVIQFLLIISLVTFAIPFIQSIISGLQYFLKE
ncbi:hypothetical protein [Empedobacter brevis]|uniref:hypothetical protein n=1 Tax=Empedobacter brevis TaxID=247 RepID=UPI00334156ED